MEKKLQNDYQRIIEMCYRARTVEEAQVALFYAELMCEQLGYDNEGLAFSGGYPMHGTMEPLHEAIWRGIGQALSASPSRIHAFEPERVNSYRGRLLKVELQNVEHCAKGAGAPVDSNLDSLLSAVHSLHDMGFMDGQAPYI